MPRTLASWPFPLALSSRRISARTSPHDRSSSGTRLPAAQLGPHDVSLLGLKRRLGDPRSHVTSPRWLADLDPDEGPT